jgi:mannose-1-phosphate guanylyltransferase
MAPAKDYWFIRDAMANSSASTSCTCCGCAPPFGDTEEPMIHYFPVTKERRAIILAGGDGSRLTAVTHVICGSDVRKQFCTLFQGDTLLEMTARRVSRLVPTNRAITVLNRAHETLYVPMLHGQPSLQFLVQPGNGGTSVAILSALLRLVETRHSGAVAIFPSEHDSNDDVTLARYIAASFTAVEASPDLIVLLGATADKPETQYDWIEPGAPIYAGHPTLGRLYRIDHFWEKQSQEIARDLYSRNCLWNSFILLADTHTLLRLIYGAIPEVELVASQVRNKFGGPREQQALEALYGKLRRLDFSELVLAKFPVELAVLPFSGLGWIDLGEPTRLLAVASTIWPRPHWLDRLRMRVVSSNGEGAKHMN